VHVERAPTYGELIAEADLRTFSRATDLLAQSPPGEYLHWDELRHLEPPGGLSHRDWWLAIKFGRVSSRRFVALEDAEGEPFSYTLPDEVLRRLHVIDQRCSGHIAMPERITSDAQAKSHYLVSALMEEAIRSSQLEGASTSRRVAKELLRSGRPPRDRGERMILNNYRAMLFMRELGEELAPGAVLELQRILTAGTLDDPSAAGRLQRPDDERVAVYDRVDRAPIHIPPPAEQLDRRLAAMCAFANASSNGDSFIHPVVRGVLLHFWLAYDHPFADGNGRTARALFYWYLRTHGYWLVEYLSISRILRNAPGRYMRAFLLTETDERDLTYFLLYQLEVIVRAIDELDGYLARKASEIRAVERLIDRRVGFNHRQVALLSDALRHGERSYTLRGHAAAHAVTHETARTDLGRLEARGLLERRSAGGRQYVFVSPADLAERLRRLESG